MSFPFVRADRSRVRRHIVRYHRPQPDKGRFPNCHTFLNYSAQSHPGPRPDANISSQHNICGHVNIVLDYTIVPNKSADVDDGIISDSSARVDTRKREDDASSTEAGEPRNIGFGMDDTFRRASDGFEPPVFGASDSTISDSDDESEFRGEMKTRRRKYRRPKHLVHHARRIVYNSIGLFPSFDCGRDDARGMATSAKDDKGELFHGYNNHAAHGIIVH